MLETLHTTLAFIVAIALLVTVHEYGHFMVARRLGIKVEKFSVGFGPALFSWTSRDGEVRYVVAAIPLGGYVKMLGEHPGEEHESLSETEKARAFDRQPVWKRALVAAAGPTFNFLFAVLAYALVAWIGQSILPPIVGKVTPASLAEQAGIKVQDRIVRVNGKRVHSWSEVEERLKHGVGGQVIIHVQRDDTEQRIPVHLPASSVDPLLVNVSEKMLGIGPGMRVIIEEASPSSPASLAGLQAGDQVLRINGMPVDQVNDLVETIRQSAGQPVVMEIQRQNKLYQFEVLPQKDAEGNVRIGVRLSAIPAIAPETYRRGPIEGLLYGVDRTWEMSVLTLQVLGKMLTSAISPDNLGGPIAIAQLAGKTADMGLVSFLAFLGLISVNLGVLNLLPVPVLDGGHLMYLSIEKVLGRPLSEKTLGLTQAIGMALIISLMVFAFYNDLMRLFRG